MSPDLDALIAEATVDCYGDNDRLIRRAAVGRAAVSATVLAMLSSGCGGAKLR